MRYYSYIRVSTAGQDYDRQEEQLKEFCRKDGINFSKVEIVKETRTGTNFNRPKLKKLIETMKEEKLKDDVCLLLVEATRLGRSYETTRDLFNVLKELDIKFVITSNPVLDTRKKDNNPASALVVDIVLNVMTWIAEEEHRTIMERTNAGRKVAKAKGVKMGRKPMTRKDLPQEFLSVMKARDKAREKAKAKAKDKDKEDTKETKTALLDSVNGKLDRHGKKRLSRTTFYNWMDIYERTTEEKKTEQ